MINKVSIWIFYLSKTLTDASTKAANEGEVVCAIIRLVDPRFIALDLCGAIMRDIMDTTQHWDHAASASVFHLRRSFEAALTSASLLFAA